MSDVDGMQQRCALPAPAVRRGGRGISGIFAKMKGALVMVPLIVAGPVSAQEMFFKCYFDWVCDPNRSCQQADLDIRYKVDLDSQTAERLGGNELSDFQIILGDRAVSFLEIPISGGVSTTTVSTMNGDAVHSENAISGIRLEPMQYIGQCSTS